MPVFNGEKYLNKSISSILTQTYTNIELVIINDGSTDKSAEIVKEFQHNDARIKYFEHSNSGVPISTNKGLELATGDWLLFVDSDDWIDIDAVQNLVDKVNKYPEVQLIRTYCRFAYDSHSELANKTPFTEQVFSTIDFIATDRVGGYISSLFVSRKVVVENKLAFSPRLIIKADMVFTWKCVLNSTKILLSDLVFYNYYIRQDSIIRTVNEVKMNNNLEAAEEVYEYAKANNNPIISDSVNRYLQSGLMDYISALELMLHSKKLPVKYRSTIIQFVRKNKMKLSVLNFKNLCVLAISIIDVRLLKLLKIITR